jgi:hypothetical protein
MVLKTKKKLRPEIAVRRNSLKRLDELKEIKTKKLKEAKMR